MAFFAKKRHFPDFCSLFKTTKLKKAVPVAFFKIKITLQSLVEFFKKQKVA